MNGYVKTGLIRILLKIMDRKFMSSKFMKCNNNDNEHTLYENKVIFCTVSTYDLGLKQKLRNDQKLDMPSI